MQSGSSYFTQRKKKLPHRRRRGRRQKQLKSNNTASGSLCPANSLEPSERRRLPKIAAPIIRTHWIGTFTPSSVNGKCREITRAELEALLLGELNSGKAESTISAVYVTLRQMFESAEDSELIRSNPMQKVKSPDAIKLTPKTPRRSKPFPSRKCSIFWNA